MASGCGLPLTHIYIYEPKRGLHTASVANAPQFRVVVRGKQVWDCKDYIVHEPGVMAGVIQKCFS